MKKNQKNNCQNSRKNKPVLPENKGIRAGNAFTFTQILSHMDIYGKKNNA